MELTDQQKAAEGTVVKGLIAEKTLAVRSKTKKIDSIWIGGKGRNK